MQNKIHKKNNPFQCSVDEYLAHLKFERRLSKNTISAYSHDLNRYIEFLFIEKNLQSLSVIELRDIEKFLKSIVKNKKLSKNITYPKSSTMNRFISSIRGYHQYLYHTGKTNKNQAQLLISPRIVKKIPPTLLVEEIDTIIQSVDMMKKYGCQDEKLKVTGFPRFDNLLKIGIIVSKYCLELNVPVQPIDRVLLFL